LIYTSDDNFFFPIIKRIYSFIGENIIIINNFTNSFIWPKLNYE